MHEVIVLGLPVFRINVVFWSEDRGYKVDTWVNGCVFPHLPTVQTLMNRLESVVNDNEPRSLIEV